MNTFLFFRYGIRILYFFCLFSQRVQILKTEYKYGQYCTPLSQSDCRYFFRVSDKHLVIARFRVQYGQYFPSFSYFADLFHEPLGE